MLWRVFMAGVRKVNASPVEQVQSAANGGHVNQMKGIHSNSSPVYKTSSDTALSGGMKNLNLQDKTGPPNRRGIFRTYSAKPTIRSLKDAASMIKDEHAKNIVVVAGAGISTPSGIPDFRTPGTGLYDNLQQYRIPYPEAIFDIDYFHHNPRPFFTLAQELYPTGKYRPNYIHYFVRLLYDRGQLLRMYTQNIDGLERLAGIPADKLVEAHGTFATAACTVCGHIHEGSQVKDEIFKDKIPQCKTRSCWGVVKPDIVFFGEDLPKRFYFYLKDMLQADMVLVMGTSLEVQPFAGIVDIVRGNVPRVLFNREPVGPFRYQRRTQDVVCEGDLIGGLQKFATMMDCKTDMVDLITQCEGTFKICEVDMSKKSKPNIQAHNGISRQRARLNLYEEYESDESSSESSDSTESSSESSDNSEGGGRRKQRGIQPRTRTSNLASVKNGNIKNEKNNNFNKLKSGSRILNGSILTSNTSRPNANPQENGGNDGGKRRIHSASRVSSLTQRRTVQNAEKKVEKQRNLIGFKGLTNKVNKSDATKKEGTENSNKDDNGKQKKGKRVLLKKSQSEPSVRLKIKENNEVDENESVQNGNSKALEMTVNNNTKNKVAMEKHNEENKLDSREVLRKKIQKEKVLLLNGEIPRNIEIRKNIFDDKRVKIQKKFVGTWGSENHAMVPISRGDSVETMENENIRRNLNNFVEKQKNEMSKSVNVDAEENASYKENLLKLQRLRGVDSLSTGLLRRPTLRTTDKSQNEDNPKKTMTQQLTASKESFGVNYAEMFCWETSIPRPQGEKIQNFSQNKDDKKTLPQTEKLQPVNNKPYGFANHPHYFGAPKNRDIQSQTKKMNPPSQLTDLPRIAYRHRLQPSYDARIMNYGNVFHSSSGSESSGMDSDECT